jgi:hypothetical protein
MLRRLLWAAVTALAMLAARRLAAALWRRAMGEDPPARAA